MGWQEGGRGSGGFLLGHEKIVFICTKCAQHKIYLTSQTVTLVCKADAYLKPGAMESLDIVSFLCH